MAGIARVILIGNMTRDPEQAFTGDQTEISKFSLAVNERTKVDGEWADRASFFDCTAFGHTAEAMNQYGAKGRQIGVDGKLRQDRWEDKDTGAKRSKIVVVATSVQFLDKPPDQGAATEADFVPADAADDDIPF